MHVFTDAMSHLNWEKQLNIDICNNDSKSLEYVNLLANLCYSTSLERVSALAGLPCGH